MNLNDQCNSVSLKEHLLALLSIERELANQQKAFINLRFELAERALELDHVEMLRRLDLLNHAHEDARQKEASFVGREAETDKVAALLDEYRLVTVTGPGGVGKTRLSVELCARLDPSRWRCVRVGDGEEAGALGHFTELRDVAAGA